MGQGNQNMRRVADADINILADYAGISLKSIPTALDSLQSNYLIEEAEPLDGSFYTTWKIYLIPAKYFKSDWLNEGAVKRYGKGLNEKWNKSLEIITH